MITESAAKYLSKLAEEYREQGDSVMCDICLALAAAYRAPVPTEPPANTPVMSSLNTIGPEILERFSCDCGLEVRLDD